MNTPPSKGDPSGPEKKIVDQSEENPIGEHMENAVETIIYQQQRHENIAHSVHPERPKYPELVLASIFGFPAIQD